MCRAVLFALLLVVAAGCARNDKPVPGVKLGASNPQEDARLKESLDAMDAAIARHEETLRRAQDAKLPEKRLDIKEAAVAEYEQLLKQYEELIALADATVKSGTMTRPRLDQFKAVVERFDRLDTAWDAIPDVEGKPRKREKK